MPRTPLYKDKTPEQILQDWLRILDTYKTKYPRLVEYDKSRITKFGPRGGYPPYSEMKQTLELYASRYKFVNLQAPSLQLAIRKTRAILGLDKFRDKRPLSPKTVVKRDLAEDKYDSNSGEPDFSKRLRPVVRDRAVAYAEGLAWQDLGFVLGFRTQRYLKPRCIFMAPFSLNLREKGYVLPLMDYFRNKRLPILAAWEGFSDVEKYLPVTAYPEIVSTDFTGMDQTVGPDQLAIFLQVLEGTFQDHQDMVHVLTRCIYAPIQVEYRKAWAPKVHGLPSGAGITNFVECILSIVMHELAIIIQGTPHQYQVLGDDGIAWGEKGLRDALVAAASVMGFEMNPEKQRTTSTNGVYLQRYFDVEEIPGVGAYPTVLAMNACVYPERFHDPAKWGPRMESLRWIMILENCKHHPAFRDLVDYVRKGDKFGLDLGSNASQLYKEAKAIGGFVPSYTQESINRGIEEFEVVKYLRGLT